MKQYFLKLNPPRPSFMIDMNEDEREVMSHHVAYWTALLEQGIAIVFGPVSEPNQVYGVGVLNVESEAQLQNIIGNDPANGLNHYEYYPMRAIF